MPTRGSSNSSQKSPFVQGNFHPLPNMILNQSITTAITLLLTIKAAIAAPAATASSNPLRGGENLIGYSPTNTISNENTETISYQLAPGQTDAADLGVYLDFDDIENPQPIRGDTGGTDPGPRKF
jgi:hypothetical protein